MSRKDDKEEIDVKKLNKYLEKEDDKNKIEACVGGLLIIIVIYFALAAIFHF